VSLLFYNMRKLFVFIFLVAVAVFSISFILKKPIDDTASKVKTWFIAGCTAFEKQTQLLQLAIILGDQKKIQQQFFATRRAYKRIEVFVEYFFPFYASRFNGPPIPFFEDKEADIGMQLPKGMQVIESLIFPELNKLQDSLLKWEATELVRYAIELPSVNESDAFDKNNITDAIIEQLYRITALTVTGFDSPVAFNSLTEANASLEGLNEIFILLQKDIQETLSSSVFKETQQLLNEAMSGLSKNNGFNSFDRMDFTLKYLNPLTNIITTYKTKAGFKSNESLRFVSAINKSNQLFENDNFDPKKFLDDFTSTPEKVQLGKQLFFDKRLSSSNDRSCASCHQPGNKAFTDGLKTSLALDGHTSLPRNAPTLWNAALQRKLFWDSRSNTLEEQVMAVLNNKKEMSGSATDIAQKITTLPDYKYLYPNAYPNSPSGSAAENICNAIAAYERTLITLNSRFDKHMRGEKSLSKREINGYNLFMGKAKCGTCHFTPLFSGAKPPRYYDIESEILGVPQLNVKKGARLDNDSGRYLSTGLAMHLFAFKTPTLRNIAFTAPYMHNGVFNTLEQVVDFYNKGGGQGLKIAPENQTLPFDKLQLTKKEKQDIILFMRSLSDTGSVVQD
jgi:cytochrome c peroxidase